MNFSKDQG